MNQTPHEFESKIQTPLLLKYKRRRCYFGMEGAIDTAFDHLPVRERTEYEKPKHEVWNLQLPRSNDFLTSEYFMRSEIHALGDANPVIIWFCSCVPSLLNFENFQIFQLPDEYDYTQHHNENDDSDFASRDYAILQEYERQRDSWKTKVLIDRW